MTNSPRQYLLTALQQLCAARDWQWPDGVQVDEPPAHVGADYATNIALQISRTLGQPPRQIAEGLVPALLEDACIESAEIAGPGFINVKFTDGFFIESLSALRADERLGVPVLSSKRVVIDFGGPNVAKPLHVGHLRSSILGESLKRIARFAGDTVYGDIHMGDWGTPMGMLLAYLQNEHPDWPYFQEGFTDVSGESPVSIEDLKTLYPLAAAKFKEDPEFAKQALAATLKLQGGDFGLTALWKHFVDVSVVAIKENMDELDVEFDWWYGESHYHDRIAPLVEKLRTSGAAVESDGALVIPIASMPDEPPMILTKSDGAFLYSTTDLAAVEERVSVDKLDLLLYVVDQRQKLHFQQLFAVAKQVGVAAPETHMEHLGFGTVNGPDGKPFKTRAGGVMQLKDLLILAHEKAEERLAETETAREYPEDERKQVVHAVALAALKYADLINHRSSDYSFDTERFTSFEGKTGPYLLYTAARIASIARKLPDTKKVAHSISATERPLALRLLGFADDVCQAYEQRAPHVLCESLYQLAATYNQFYHQTNIVNEQDINQQETWLALSDLAHRQFVLGLNLLAIPSVERL